MGKNQRIVRATAGNNQLVDFRFAQNETIQGLNDRERGENGRSANEIVRCGAIAQAKREDFLHISVPVIFAPGGFWRRKFQVGIAQQFVKERGIAAALRGKLRVFVKALAAPREMRNQRVDEHVGRSRVECKHLLRLGGARKDGNVGNPSEIQRNAAEFRVAVEKIIHVGNERRALPTERHIRGAKIANRWNARACSDDRWFANLQRGWCWRAKIRSRFSLMENRLAVAPD